MSEKVKISFVEKVIPDDTGKGIVPLAMEKLPLGSIEPENLLKKQLKIALGGLPGTLWKKGAFLGENNGWLNPEKLYRGAWTNFDRPWEEQAYFLRALVPLAVQTKDPEILGVVEKYMKKMLESRESDGWFGPQGLKHTLPDDPKVEKTYLDLWPHMLISEAVLDWYEYTRDPAYLSMLKDFMYFCLNVPDENFINEKNTREGYSWIVAIQFPRACDIIPSICRVIALTGDEGLMPLIHRFYKRWYGPVSEYMNHHTVNFAQQFAYRTYYSRASRCQWHRESADYWYDQHMAVWGTVPRGAFCADENIRKNCTDPRYGTETCTFVEFCRSFNYLGELNMECRWADRIEDVLFNHYPASLTKDMKKVHYITCSNQVMLDDCIDHNVANFAHMFAYTDTQDRCCLHNAGLAFPRMAEYMMTKVFNGGVCAWLHGPYTASLTAGKENIPVKWRSVTDYPFRDKITFVLQTEKKVEFPFYIRIPKWCKAPILSLNGKKLDLEKDAVGKFVVLERLWENGDEVILTLPSEITLSRNIRNGGITVDKGPFSYSLLIPERENTVVSSSNNDDPAKEIWNEKNDSYGNVWTEILPDGDWNFGLLPEMGFVYEEREIEGEYIFSPEGAPMRILAYGKRIPNWKLQDNMVAPLQNSPVKSSEETVTLTLIPLGCARLRLSVFPVISDDEWANEWVEVPASTPKESRMPIRL